MDLLRPAPPRSRFPLLRRLLGALITIGLLLANAAQADIKGPLIFTEDALETHHIAVRVDEGGRGEILAYPCADCPPRAFPVEGPVPVVVDGRPRPHVPLRTLDGQPATVIFDLQNGRTLRLVK